MLVPELVYCCCNPFRIPLCPFCFAACARCMLVTAITDQAELLRNGKAICIDPPWFTNRLTCVITANSNKTIHAPIEVRGLQVVVLGKGNIRTLPPILALTWPLNGKTDIRTAMLSNV